MSDQDEYFALKAGKLDAYICCDPWGSMAEYEDTGWVVIRQNTERNGFQGTCCRLPCIVTLPKPTPDWPSGSYWPIPWRFSTCTIIPIKLLKYLQELQCASGSGLNDYVEKTNEEGRTISWDLKMDEMENQLATMRKYGVQDDINNVNLADYVDSTYMDNCGAKDFKTLIKNEVDPHSSGNEFRDWKAKAMEVDNIKA